jgi:quercetin dioxygenase-like cupin family protein
MAHIRRMDQLSGQSGTGWTRTDLADPGSRHGLPMRAERWRLEASISRPLEAAGDETMLYVIAGTGTIRIGDTTYEIEPESVVWLTAGDPISVTAGADGLEILMGTAGPR